MGGNALKQYENKRLDKFRYFLLVSKFARRFHHEFGFEPVLIPAYKHKPSFGDADFLIDSSQLPPNWTAQLIYTFDLTDAQYTKNGTCVSIGWNHFQFDLIVTPHDEMDSAYFYFSYNDFGNLIGRIGHKLGIKIGHRGLSLVVRRETHILKEIFFSKNAKDALDILGLNPEIYDRGFNNLEDMFAYVASSKYFDPWIYSLEHRSATSRVRDKKRATYSAFLKWVAETHPKQNHSFENKSELGGYSIRLPYYYSEVISRWPWVEQEVNEVIADFELNQKFKEVYNGEIVTQLTGYTGKTLGAFMAQMKPKLTQENKAKWVKSPILVEMNVVSLWIELGGVQFKVD